MAYKQTAGRSPMAKTGRGLDSALLQVDPDPKKSQKQLLKENREKILSGATGSIGMTDRIASKFSSGKMSSGDFEKAMKGAARIQRKSDSITMTKSPKSFYDRSESTGEISRRKKSK
tara:strand:- start:254 stop:604 length:351 start_codon:yes stop_codon:yes gene_type:complete